ncbi:MAG TPA: S9 family peptidase [Symbiobacteriaceae bacterium]
MTRRLQAEDLLSFKLAGDVQMALTGDRIAYVVKSVDREKNSYKTAIYMVRPGEEPVRFTGGESDASPQFSPDGTHLAFISKRSGQPQIWVMRVDGGEAWQLTRVQGGVVEFRWAPDSRRIAFTANLKEDGIQPEVKEEKEEDLFKKHTKDVKVITELFHKLDGEGYFGPRRPCLCVIDVAEGAQPRQLTYPPYRVSGLSWSPDGNTIVFESRMGPDYDRDSEDIRIYAIPATGGEPKELTPAGFACGRPEVSPDGKTVALVATLLEEMGYDNPGIYLVPLEGGPMTRVAGDWDRPFTNETVTDMPAPGRDRLIWSPDGRYIYSICSMEGTTQLVRVEVATGTVTVLTRGDRQIYSYSLDAACRKAALGIADPLNPGDIYLADLETGAEERLTRLNEELLSQLELSEPKRFRARAEGGPEIDGWVMKPCGFEEGKRYPTILFIHGGPMAMYASSFFFEFQLMAAQGFGVVYSNPRGSMGYGQEFCMAIQREWGNKDYADIMAVLDQAIAENPWIDPDRLGVTGGSYGGYMTNWIVSHTDRFKAAVTGRSVVDWRAMSGTDDVGPTWTKRAAGVPHWVDDSWYKQQSPITYVENVRTPILIEHQEGDLRCPVEQALMWYTAIKYLNRAPVKLVLYPNEFHGMSRTGKPWYRVHRLVEISNWFNQYLKG